MFSNMVIVIEHRKIYKQEVVQGSQRTQKHEMKLLTEIIFIKSEAWKIQI